MLPSCVGSGDLKDEDVIDWLLKVEEVLDLNEVPDDRRVKLVTTRFPYCAKIWWQQLKKHRVCVGKHKIFDWEKFKKNTRAAFFSNNFER